MPRLFIPFQLMFVRYVPVFLRYCKETTAVRVPPTLEINRWLVTGTIVAHIFLDYTRPDMYQSGRQLPLSSLIAHLYHLRLGAHKQPPNNSSCKRSEVPSIFLCYHYMPRYRELMINTRMAEVEELMKIPKERKRHGY